MPVELGVRVCVLEDQHQFILHHRVMWQETDDQIAVPMIEDALKRFPMINQCSFDKGFYSKSNILGGSCKTSLQNRSTINLFLKFSHRNK